MKTTVAENELRHYREQGFLAIADFLTAAELQMWRERIDRAVHGRNGVKLPDGSWAEGPGESSHGFIQRLNLWHDNREVRDLALDPRIGRLVAELEGVGGVRLYLDQAIYKGAFGNAVPWHNDNAVWAFHSRNAATCWIALDDVGLENGCLYFLPRTHERMLIRDDMRCQNMADFLVRHPELFDIEPQSVPVPAGGCVIFNSLCAHASGANMTRHPRRAFTMSYMPIGSIFNGTKSILPDSLVPRLRVGDALDQDDYFPLVFGPPA